MRATIIPAEITTVEDRVLGDLSTTQSILIVIATLGITSLFAVLPPFFTYSSYKLLPMGCFAAVNGVLAIRIKGKLILDWIAILGRYMFRPRYYISDKRSSYLRVMPKALNLTASKKETAHQELKKPVQRPHLSVAEVMNIESLVANPHAQVRFKTTKKGKISVHFTEIQ